MEPTFFDFTSGPLYQGEIHRCYWGLRQKSVTREVIGSSGEATTIALLGDVLGKVPPYFCASNHRLLLQSLAT